MPTPVVGPIAIAIAEVAKVIGRWQNSADRRRMRKAAEAAESYIFVNERRGEYGKITDARQTKLLNHFRKRFFHYD